MPNKNKKKAFTLVELMVAMAIIAVLIGLAAFGISTLQRLSRDNQRRQVTLNLQTYIEGYYNDKFSYPAAGAIRFSNGRFTITTDNYGNNRPGPEGVGPAAVKSGNPPAQGGADIDGTYFCYARRNDGYSLEVLLESDEWFNASTSTTRCSTPTLGNLITPQ